MRRKSKMKKKDLIRELLELATAWNNDIDADLDGVNNGYITELLEILTKEAEKYKKEEK